MAKMGDVWDRTTEFLSDNIGAVVPVALLAFFVPTSIGGNFAALQEGGSDGLALGLSVVQIAFALLSLWGSMTIMAMALDMSGQETAGSIAWRRMPAAIAVMLLSFAALIATILPLSVILMMGGADMEALAAGRADGLGEGTASVALLYLLVFGVLLLWIGARMALTLAVVVREGRVLRAFTQSWKLTRGMTLKIIGVILLFMLVAWVSIIAAQFVFGSIFRLIAGGADGVSLAGVLTSIVVAAVQTCFQVLMAAFIAKLYRALTARAGLGGSVPTT